MQKVFLSKEADIRKKLMQSGINKSEQFEQIISNLINQRERLQVDLKILREKVIALQAKQAKRITQAKTRPHLSAPKKQINYRQQLNKKYEQLKFWQKKSLKANSNTSIQMQYRAYLDRLFSVEQQIQLTLKQISDERTSYDKLKKALRLIKKDDKINNNMHEGIQRQNTILKKRVFSLKKIVDRQIGKELELHNYLIDMKEKEREIRQKERQKYVLLKQSKQVEKQRDSRTRSRQIKRRKTQYVKPRQSSQISEESELVVDIDIRHETISSKQQIYQVQGRLNRFLAKYRQKINQIQRKIQINYPNEALIQRRQGSKLTYGRQFQITLDKVKNNLTLLGQLHRKEIQSLFMTLKEKNKSFASQHSRKSSQQSLMLGIKDHKYNYKLNIASNIKNQANQFYNSQKIVASNKFLKQKSHGSESQPMINKTLYPRVFAEQQMQCQNTQYIDCQPLRKQYVGTISNLTIYDRNILKTHKQSTIQMLHIYYSDRGISTVTATYNIHNSQNDTIQSKLHLPESFIQNYCKVHVISTNNDDFIRYFKIKVNKAQGRVVSIKTVTNRNIKGGWGDYKFKQDYDKQEIQDEEILKQLILDIDKDEYPVSIFCSHTQKGPYWYLSGFGVQINEL